MAMLDPSRPVLIEAESSKIGDRYFKTGDLFTIAPDNQHAFVFVWQMRSELIQFIGFDNVMLAAATGSRGLIEPQLQVANERLC